MTYLNTNSVFKLEDLLICYEKFKYPSLYIDLVTGCVSKDSSSSYSHVHHSCPMIKWDIFHSLEEANKKERNEVKNYKQ